MSWKMYFGEVLLLTSLFVFYKMHFRSSLIYWTAKGWVGGGFDDAPTPSRSTSSAQNEMRPSAAPYLLCLVFPRKKLYPFRGTRHLWVGWDRGALSSSSSDAIWPASQEEIKPCLVSLPLHFFHHQAAGTKEDELRLLIRRGGRKSSHIRSSNEFTLYGK